MPEIVLSDYFYGDESEEFVFFKVPRQLITNPKFKHVSNLPLNKVNRVNNLVSLHKNCYIAVNNSKQDISEFDVKAQKKIIGYREKLVTSHTRNNQSALMERRVR